MAERLTRWLPGADEEADQPRPRPDADVLERLGLRHPDLPLRPLPVRWALGASAGWLAGNTSLRRLPVEHRIAALARLARSWTDPHDPFRVATIEAAGEAGLTPEQVAWGLDRAFEVIDEDALERWWKREGGAATAALSGHIWSGNVVTAGLPPVLASVLAGVPALIKAPGDQPTFATQLAASIAVHAPELGDCVGAAAWDRSDEAATATLFGTCAPVFAMADDASLTALRRFGPVVGFGHRVSVACVTPAVDLAALLTDTLAWDGGGCLTPRWTFVVGAPPQVLALARRAAELAPAIAQALPSLPLPPGIGAERATWLAQAAFAGFCTHGRGWAVAVANALSDPPPRTLVLIPVDSPAHAAALLAPLGDVLQGIACDPGVSWPAPAARQLADQGLSRWTVPGRLQVPPVHWNHDGVAILAALTGAPPAARAPHLRQPAEPDDASP